MLRPSPCLVTLLILPGGLRLLVLQQPFENPARVRKPRILVKLPGLGGRGRGGGDARTADDWRRRNSAPFAAFRPRRPLDLRTALEAFRDEPVHVIATMPAGIPAGLDIPPNATVKEFVPHSAVLGRAAVAVTHGGMGSTQKALAKGVPVCVVPFGRDQLEVARRVEVSRSGMRLPASRLTPERLKAAVKAAMAMTEGARRVAAGYAAAGGASAAADAIEARLLHSPQSPRTGKTA